MATYCSPAKINLFLRIMGKRPDNYHEIASLFQTISLHDVLSIRFSNEDRLRCTDPAIPTDRSNLILKAVDLFRRKTDLQFHVEIELDKRIPHQAGLGGGSSNAATTLWALNDLFNRPVTTNQLAGWGAEIGSDVAFFLSHGTAYCTGRGEMIRELPPLPQTELLVIKPKEGLSTPEVFRNLDLAKCAPQNPETLLDNFIKGSPHFVNDLELPAFKAMPALKTLKETLKDLGYHDTLMTGSGSAFFCVGNTVKPALANLFVEKAAFVNRSKNEWYQIQPPL